MTSYIRPPSHHVTNDCYKKMSYHYKEKNRLLGMMNFTLYLELIKESRENNLASLLNYIKKNK